MSTPAGRPIVVTIHLEANPLFPITATDTFLHLVRWLQRDGIVASATLDIPDTGTLSAVTNFPPD
ncbi:MAG: hypothetical protein LC700_02275 [Actinobacteria bacterium]|nr:hypothetical protein [Actinomycetota bacterium]